MSLVFQAALAWARDTDADGVDDLVDTCPLVADPGQSDGDLDGTGDACDVCAGLGNGLEHFGAGAVVERGTVSQALVAADLDLDGDDDLVNQMGVAENVGGALTAPVATGWGYAPAVADLDGDGLPDVVSFQGGNAAWSRNAGGLLFDPPVKLPDSEIGGNGVALLDVDQDGLVDIATSASVSGVTWRRNLGGGSFGPRTVVDPTAAYAIVAAEIDGDGRPDLVAATSSYPSAAIRWYRDLGGSFSGYHPVEREWRGIDALSAADLDGDGLDEVFAEAREAGILAYRNVAGRFVLPGEQVMPASGFQQRPGPIAVTDLDGDGDVDLVGGSGDPQDGPLRWRENVGRGQLAAARAFGTLDGVGGIAALDVDLDGAVDLAVGSESGIDRGTWWFPAKTCAVHDGDGDGLPDCNEVLRHGSDPSAVDSDGDGLHDGDEVEVGADPRRVDSDADGTGDLADACPVDPLDDVDGDGTCGDRDTCPTLANPAQSDVDGDAVGDPCDTCLGDDASGNPDGDALCDSVDLCDFVPGFSFADRDDDGAGDACDVCGAESTGLEILSSTLTNLLPCMGYEGCSTAPTQLWAAADMDGDGDEDLLFQNGPGLFVSPSLQWLPRRGPDRWAALPGATSIPIQDLSAVVAEDLDGDGDVDLLTADRVRNRVELHPNVGTPSFPAHLVLSTVADPTGLAAADLDGDGDVDAVATFGSADRVTLFENSGGTLVVRELATGLGGPRAVVTVDLDGDLDLDLAVTTPDGVGWLENLGGGTFSAAAPLAALPEADRIEVGDVDGDGSDDLVVVAFDRGVYWLPNDGAPPFGTVPIVTGRARVADLGDLDGDGDPDLVVRIGSSTRDPDMAVSLYENRAGWFDPPESQAMLPDTLLLADTNGDTLLDLVVGTYGDLSSLEALTCALRDVDGDGLHDGEELLATGTDPTLADTDGGGRTDEEESIFDGTDPLDPSDDLP